MSKKVSILGSTGSIGTQAIDVCMSSGFEVVSLSANKNIKLLSEQAMLVKAKEAVVSDKSLYAD